MKINKEQALLLLEKLEKEVYEDLDNYNYDANTGLFGDSNKMINYEYCGHHHVQIIKYKHNRVSLYVQNSSSSMSFSLTSPNGQEIYSTWYISGFDHFSKAARLWKKLAKVVDKFNTHKNEIQRNQREKKELETFNSVVYSAYQEEVEKIILGEDNEEID